MATVIEPIRTLPLPSLRVSSETSSVPPGDYEVDFFNHDEEGVTFKVTSGPFAGREIYMRFPERIEVEEIHA